MGMGLLDYTGFLCDYIWKWFTLYDLDFLLLFTEKKAFLICFTFHIRYSCFLSQAFQIFPDLPCTGIEF